jgi:uncharacterized membrane protein YkvA (DUF1232 family)
MTTEYKSFYDVLREYIDSYEGEYEGIVDYGPDIFKLLADILNEKIIGADMRLKIGAALGYFVAPFDVIPEVTAGPNGYIDDIFICIHVIKEIAEEIGYESLEDLWEGEDDLKNVVNRCYNKSKEILGDKTALILSYVGLK